MKNEFTLKSRTPSLKVVLAALLVAPLAATSITVSLFGPQASASTSNTLFSKGAEHFKILDQKGEAPQFRILADSMSKQALAIAAIGLLNAQTEVKPKLPITSYIDLKPQMLTLTPQGRDQVALAMKLNGYDVDLEKTVSKQALLSGQSVEVKYPMTAKDVGLSSVETSGTLKLHLDRQTQNLILENVDAKLSFSNPLGDNESERVRFSGTAKRIQ